MEPGTRLAERYRIERTLGRGGMGEVYVAHDDRFDSRVALKVARASGALHDEFRARFIREARIGNRLGRTDGFVRALDWGETAEGLYLAMDLVEGARPLDLATGTLAERLARLESAAKLVVLAHERGVVHRDLKPANFLQDAAGHIWIADFGLAKAPGEPDSPGDGSAKSSLTQSGIGLGTPAFMPPEQFEDARSVDARADVYALGVMLFYALTGRVPFDGTPTAILRRQERVKDGKEPAPSPRALLPDLPDSLDSLCRRAIALVREERLETAQAFVAGLEAVASGENAVLTATPVRVAGAPELASTLLEATPTPAEADPPRAPVSRRDEPAVAVTSPAPVARLVARPATSAPVARGCGQRGLLLGCCLLFAGGIVAVGLVGAMRQDAAIPSPTRPHASSIPTPPARPALEPGGREALGDLAVETARYRLPDGSRLDFVRLDPEGATNGDGWVLRRCVTETELAAWPAHSQHPGQTDRNVPARVSYEEATAYAQWAKLALLDADDLETQTVPLVLRLLAAQRAREGQPLVPEWTSPDSSGLRAVEVGREIKLFPTRAGELYPFRVVYPDGP